MRELVLSFIVWLACGICVPLPAAAEQPTSAESAGAEVILVELVDQSISPVTASFIERAIEEADQSRAECLIISLDTPGGLLQSTQRIVTAILTSRVPVVVYVSPPGGRAASAGLFITLASHVAAMAPGTRIGAAHPVQFGGLPIGPQPPAEQPDTEEPTGDEVSNERGRMLSAMEEKIVNDTEAWARGLAILRGRDADWAAAAVTESRVVVSSEAVDQGVVEFEAADVDDLLAQLDGREVEIGQELLVLNVADARVRSFEMWWGERFLAVISNPNIVMLLLMFGVYGILFEFYSPGWGVAGTLGVVSLVLAFFGMSVLPVSYAGLALIVVGLAMFVAEVTVTSFGALTVGGIICFILGGMMLVDSPTGFLRVSLGVLIPIAVATGLITVFLLSCIVRAHRGRVQAGGELLLDVDAVAETPFAPDARGFHGQVFLHGELWQARSDMPVDAGAVVRVTARDGLMLEVCADGDTNAAKTSQT